MNPKKSWSSLIWLVSTFCLLAFTSLSAATLKVGLVTDVGRVNDRSFNQSAWEGVQVAKKQLGLNDRHVKYIKLCLLQSEWEGFGILDFLFHVPETPRRFREAVKNYLADFVR